MDSTLNFVMVICVGFFFGLIAARFSSAVYDSGLADTVHVVWSRHRAAWSGRENNIMRRGTPRSPAPSPSPAPSIGARLATHSIGARKSRRRSIGTGLHVEFGGQRIAKETLDWWSRSGSNMSDRASVLINALAKQTPSEYSKCNNPEGVKELLTRDGVATDTEKLQKEIDSGMCQLLLVNDTGDGLSDHSGDESGRRQHRLSSTRSEVVRVDRIIRVTLNARGPSGLLTLVHSGKGDEQSLPVARVSMVHSLEDAWSHVLSMLLARSREWVLQFMTLASRGETTAEVQPGGEYLPTWHIVQEVGVNINEGAYAASPAELARIGVPFGSSFQVNDASTGENQWIWRKKGDCNFTDDVTRVTSEIPSLPVNEMNDASAEAVPVRKHTRTLTAPPLSGSGSSSLSRSGSDSRSGSVGRDSQRASTNSNLEERNTPKSPYRHLAVRNPQSARSSLLVAPPRKGSKTEFNSLLTRGVSE